MPVRPPLLIRRVPGRVFGLLLAIATTLLAAGVAAADVVVLDSGARLEGRIVRESPEEVVLVMERGRITLERARITAIERDQPQDRSEEEGDERHPPPRLAQPRGLAVWDAPVTVEARGGGIKAVRVTLRSTSDSAVRVRLPAGILFVSRERNLGVAPQDMLAVDERVTTVPAGGEVELAVPVTCGKMRRRVPYRSDLFDLKPPTQEGIARLARSLRRESNWAIQQAAVWIVTDDADYEDLGTLRTSTMPGTSGVRTIRVPEAVRALRYVDTTVLDAGDRRIWGDRFLLLHALSPDPAEPDGEGLRRWARGVWSGLGYPEDLPSLLTRVLEDPNAGPACRAEAFRVAARERLVGLVPVLVRSLARWPELDGDVTRKALARLGAEDVATLEDAQPASADSQNHQPPSAPTPDPAVQPVGTSPAVLRRIDDLLARLALRDPEAQADAVLALWRLEDVVVEAGDRRRIAEALLDHARLRVHRRVHADGLARVLQAYRDVVPVREVIALSRVRRLGERECAIVRLLAACTLAAYPEQAASERLVDLLADSDAGVRTHARKALVPPRENAQPALRRLARSGAEVDVRRAAVRAMGTSCPQGSRQERALLRLLEDEDAEIRSAAAATLGAAKSRAAIRPLVQLLQDRASAGRTRDLVGALVQIGEPALREIERALAREESRLLRDAYDRIQGAH